MTLAVWAIVKEGLDLLAELVKGHEAEAVVAAIRRGFDGHTEPEKALDELAALRAALLGNDTKADAALVHKFDHGGEQ